LSFSTLSDHVIHIFFIINCNEFFWWIFKCFEIQDYGSLSCWAKNEIGTQTQPCIFQLILAGRFYYSQLSDKFDSLKTTSTGPPSSVLNCSWTNETENSLYVNCSPNYDGGLPQIFVLEVISLKLKIPM
jgi:hypothetical protein